MTGKRKDREEVELNRNKDEAVAYTGKESQAGGGQTANINKSAAKKPKAAPSTLKIRGHESEELEGPSLYRSNPAKTWPRQDPPIMHADDIPEEMNWDPNDSDIDEEDIEGNINRCLERIDTGILPQIWERRLKRYRAREKDWAKRVRKEPEGLSDASYERIDQLRLIEKHLKKQDDPQRQLPNVVALLRAYRSQALNLEDGKVAYFCGGRMIDGPKPWNVQEYLALATDYRGSGAFWVEGLPDLRNSFDFQGLIVNPVRRTKPVPRGPPFHHLIHFEIRIPGYTNGRKYEFLDDSGASHPSIYGDELWEIQTLADAGQQPEPPTLGSNTILTSNGPVVSPYVMLEMRVAQAHIDVPLTDWILVPTRVGRESQRPRTNNGCAGRVSGSWWRWMLYTATCPNSYGDLYLTTDKTLLVEHLPECDPRQAQVPYLH